MNTNPLRTLTISLLIFFSVVAIGFETLYGYFSSNVILNGIVISAMMFGLTYIYLANIKLQGIINLFKETDALLKRNKNDNDEEDEDDNDDDSDDLDDLEFDEDEYADLMEKKGKRLKWLMSDKDVEVIKNWSPSKMFNRDQVETALSASRLRIAEVRNFSNYFSGILIILGLLGTFLGLLETIKAIGEVFSGDSIKFLVADKADTSSDDILVFFDAISKPLGGMGIAFSSSLFGLSGSLIVGLFAFISSRNQSFFLFDLFDWFKVRTQVDDMGSLDRSVMTSLPSSHGLMGALVRGGMKLPSGQSMRTLSGGGISTGMGTATAGAGVGMPGGGGMGGEFRGEFKGEFRGDGDIRGTLDADALSAVLNRLEGLSRDAIEKNGLIAKAALKLGENLALEQKRLADIATYEQQTAVSLSAIRQQGDQQIHILNQLVEAQYSNTDKEEFRSLAAHFHRSFENLMGDVRENNEALSDKISKIGLAGMAAVDNLRDYTRGQSYNQQSEQQNQSNSDKEDTHLGSIKANPVNPLKPSNDENNSSY